jgi:hypothetical protein
MDQATWLHVACGRQTAFTKTAVISLQEVLGLHRASVNRPSLLNDWFRRLTRVPRRLSARGCRVERRTLSTHIFVIDFCLHKELGFGGKARRKETTGKTKA